MNEDYTPITDKTLIFSQDSLINCVNVSILPDAIVERNEVFSVSLNSDDVVVMFGQQEASIVIVDSDKGIASSHVSIKCLEPLRNHLHW